MNKHDMVARTAEHVKTRMNDESGHDWWHVYRVWTLSKKIGEEEGTDMFIVEMAALLHDVADWKFHGEGVCAQHAREWMEKLGADKNDIEKVVHIVDNISFKGSAEREKMETHEGKIVQDADRLDALGAIGISRVFSFAGHMQNPIYEPDIKPRTVMTFEQYKTSKAPAINHFYEKLLLLKGRMNTKTAKRIAEERHKFMEQYLDRFFKEWQGEE